MLLDEELKQEWLNNIPAALLYEDKMRRSLEPTTKEAIYNRVLVETGDKELAEKAKAEFWMQEKLAKLEQGKRNGNQQAV